MARFPRRRRPQPPLCRDAPRTIGIVATLAAALAATFAATPSFAGEVAVSGDRILVDGKPFVVHGAAGWEQLDVLKGLGANAIRTYGDLGNEVLDPAEKLGLKVALGFWLEPPRRGFDYANRAAVEEQLARLEAFVRAHKDHPALLMWGIGNEVEAEAPDPDLVYAAIGEAARRTKAIDPDHPTMAVLAETGEDKVRRLMKFAPDIDVLGLNSYGEALPSVIGRARAQGWTGPIVVTELGVIGQWDAPKTEWGAAVEPTSTAKATLLARYLGALEAGGAGEFVFFWGQKQEVTPTWHGLITPTGEWTGTAEAMATAWGGTTPGGDRAPRIARLAWRDGDRWPASGEGVAVLETSDPDGDPISVEWTVMEESRDLKTGGDAESVPPSHAVALKAAGPDGATVTGLAPGHYRLFVTVRDGRGAAATGNLPFAVQ